MKIDIDFLLKSFADTLRSGGASESDANVTAESAAIIAWGLGLVAQEVDRLADTLKADNREIRLLLSNASKIVGSPDLSARLKQAAQTDDNSLRIHTLDRSNDELNKLLIELQVYLEEQTSPEAKSLTREILLHLKSAAGRRRFTLST